MIDEILRSLVVPLRGASRFMFCYDVGLCDVRFFDIFEGAAFWRRAVLL